MSNPAHWSAQGDHVLFTRLPGGRINDDGTVTLSMRFPVLRVSEWIEDTENTAQQIADALNVREEMLEALIALAALAEIELGASVPLDMALKAIAKGQAVSDEALDGGAV
ncbi:hypothetical protein IFT84_10210 [Rhizobium sp. CFBP 8762]|uniref:hypothetical protein n=1 Tax=Rhizobium sp. CFBP 8762 TaxID=2775279 RepID=UPI001780C33E|nr:hypothetical protein [Rhizobium sp. CFBP 8762]MBD8554896.1 hypothetical protein [Rhizobium sp. CFBP 8762]